MASQQIPVWRTPFLMASVGLSAFTSGTIASLTLVTIPAILQTTTDAALLACWRQTLEMGVKICPPFAVLASLAHATNAYLYRHAPSNTARISAIAAVSTIAIVPFTFIFMSPTNGELFKREQSARGTTVGVERTSLDLVRKWGRLNLTRSVLPAAGALIACFAL